MPSTMEIMSLDICEMRESANDPTRQTSLREPPLGANAGDVSTRSSIAMRNFEGAVSNSWPKLGDFRKLYRDNSLSCSSRHDSHVDSSARSLKPKFVDRDVNKSVPVCGADFKLGDFRKVRHGLGQDQPEPVADAFRRTSENGDAPPRIRPTSPELRAGQAAALQLPSPPLSDTASLSSGLRDVVQEPPPYEPKTCSESEADSVDPQGSESSQTTSTTEILSYKMASRGSTLPVFDKKPSLDQKHEALLMRLVPIRVADVSVMTNNRSVALNGVHVFLDMSNINISFQHALRKKYSIRCKSRFSPLPQLNLQFLTEILVRERKTMALNAGCSVLPDRHEPRFIQELRTLGYRVDLRERRLTTEPKGGPYSAASKGNMAALHTVARFMEDLVDETLQTRIAESVMEHFARPGTLVLATGDAQPAKYSDGFYTYAERALRMGWCVEVVSWNLSLSSRWRKSNLALAWGDRFRLISLDEFLDQLLL